MRLLREKISLSRMNPSESLTCNQDLIRCVKDTVTHDHVSDIFVLFFVEITASVNSFRIGEHSFKAVTDFMKVQPI